MNKKEILILSNLRKNGREKLTNISKETSIPVSTIFDKIKSYEASLIIKRHSCLLNFSKLGYEIDVCLLIKSEKDEREKLKEFLEQKNCLNSIFRITSSYDFLVEGIFKDMQELHDFLEKMEETFNLTRIEVLYIVGELKRENFLINNTEAKYERI